MTTPLTKAKRLVIKVGSALLVDAASGDIRRDWLTALSDDIAELHRAGKDIVVVSSGAIALGRKLLDLKSERMALEESQAAAAIGQITLAQAWQSSLAHHDITTAQVLLTLNDTEERRRYLNARSTLNTLLSRRAIPVINENDTVATSEIRYGDNDRLAARVSSMLSADCLVLLSDVDGLYSAPPGNADARFIETVDDISPEIEAMAGDSASLHGSGGMITKIEAAKIATAAGADMAIAAGGVLNPLKRLQDTNHATWFIAKANPMTARKRWIGGTLEPIGNLIIDDGAEAALRRGKSLLPAGVAAIEGRFSRGDAVSIRNLAGREIARGLCAYDAEDAQRIAGRKTSDIYVILGFSGRDEMVHRDDMVVKS